MAREADPSESRPAATARVPAGERAGQAAQAGTAEGPSDGPGERKADQATGDQLPTTGAGQGTTVSGADGNRGQATDIRGKDDDAEGEGFASLRQGHEALRALINEGTGSLSEGQAGRLLARLAPVWAAHAQAHEVLHAAIREARPADPAPFEDSAIETDLVSILLSQDEVDPALDAARLRVAVRLIGEIIEREDKPRTGLLAKARAAGVNPASLGRRIAACTPSPRGGDGPRTPRLRHLVSTQEDIMPRNSNMPERDDRGRFVSDDDRGGRDGRSRRHDDDDRPRDDRGRFMAEDDRRQGRRDPYGSRRHDDDRRTYARREDDDRDYGRDRDSDRGHGGWFGDPEGHSEASRRGWDHRRDDDGDYRARGSRRYNDNDDRGRSRDHGQGGWFGDPEGHSEASRRGWDHRRDDDGDYRARGSRRYDDNEDRRGRDRGGDSDHGHGGWFGDPEGHSEASRRGWDHRRDDDGDYRARGSRRYDDDDDGRGRARGGDSDRGRGGWFGDPEGHSEASRRGWDQRRDDDDDRRYARGRR